MIRVISPDEYDAAARLHPALCPLVAVGDTRCGRRLLSEADADATRGFSAVSSTIGDDECSGESGVIELYCDAARAVALRLRSLTKTPAAAASSAMLGRKRVKSELEENACKQQYITAGAFTTASDKPASQAGNQSNSKICSRRIACELQLRHNGSWYSLTAWEEN
jgi:hypothetical protein